MKKLQTYVKLQVEEEYVALELYPGKLLVYTDETTGRSLYVRYSGSLPDERTEVLIYDKKADKWTTIELPWYAYL